MSDLEIAFKMAEIEVKLMRERADVARQNVANNVYAENAVRLAGEWGLANAQLSGAERILRLFTEAVAS